MMVSSSPPEIVPENGALNGEEEAEAEEGLDRPGAVEAAATEDIDISGETWDVPLFERLAPDRSAEGLYVYNNRFSIVPRSIGRFAGLKSLKFFANESYLLPPEAGGLLELERLQVKFPSFGVFGFPFQKMSALKELELCRIPPRPSAFSILSEIAGVKCLTKLSVCHFSIRYLPPEIGCLKKLEELDLSFNKLKRLPNAISGLIALQSLRVSNNKLMDLPAALSNLSRLENLDLSNNRLTSLEPLDFDSMPALQYLNLQYNKLLNCCQIPARICCNLEGNRKDTGKDEKISSLVEVDILGEAFHRVREIHSCKGSTCSSSSLLSEATFSGRYHASQRMPKGWKRRDSLQQKARQERLNYSRKCRGHDYNDVKIMKMDESDSTCNLSVLENGEPELQFDVNEDKQFNNLSKPSFLSEDQTCITEDINIEVLDISGDSNSQGSKRKDIGSIETDSANDFSCITSESSGLDKDCDYESEVDSKCSSPCQKIQFDASEDSSSEASKISSKSKRHCDKDLDNPKPRKCRRPVDKCSYISSKYSTESFCGTDDHLPDGFYDAGRDRPFMPLQNYEERLSLDSREIILLDRGRDEELEAIVLSAQILLSRLKIFDGPTERNQHVVNDFQRASMLALFVSDCFGGSDRSYSIMKIRRSVVGSNKQQPFICTCSAVNHHDDKETNQKICGFAGSFNFTDLCEKSLWLIKETRNSNIVPIGSLRFGVCRHRAVLMKYLCDRMDPPIPCELVRGYLDFMPHAWNAILLRQGHSWVRLVVDTCYPTDIREETDPEYFCRYIPLSRALVPLMIDDSSSVRCSFPSLSSYLETEKARSVKHCKFGMLDAAAKVRHLDANEVSEEDVKIFEYTFLGEVRMLGALRNHRCIVEIYGHQLSSKWVAAVEGNREHRLLQSVIVMEYIKGGSLKNYVEKLSKQGEKHAPIDLAIHIARDVALALVEVHSKKIIHRDIKSENILIDLDSKRVDGSPVVKLSDFDRAVPLQSFLHTCCIAHLGIHPPNICVGTPRWMAPEVLKAMDSRSLYGLEVDIWSYGCLLLELLTLKFPYEGLPDSEIYDLLQMKQRPKLTPDLEELASSNTPARVSSVLGSPCSDTDTEKLKILVELFYQCTSGNPTERPTASQIYDTLNEISPSRGAVI